jgi:hypothetical protein
MNIPQTLGLPAYYNQLDNLRGLSGSTTIPTVSVSGYNNVGTGLIYGVVNTYVLSPSLIKVMGRHTLKFGAELRRMDFNYYQDNNAGGNFAFNNLFTSQNALSPGATGDGFASFLLGLPNSGQVQSSIFTAAGMHYQGYYANDSFQMTNRLTVNIGVRWEVPGVYTERHDRQDVFDLNSVNPVLAQDGITVNGAPVKGQYVLVNSPGHRVRGLTPEYWNLFAPRVGVAYRLTDSTVLRAGGGLFYLPADAVFPEGPDQAAVTYLYNTMVPSIDNDVTILNTLSNPYPNGFQPTTQRNPIYQAALLGLANLRAPLGNHPYPYTWQWNFTVQHQFPKDVALEVGYSGLRGLHLPRGNPANQYDVLPGQEITSMGSKLLQLVPNPFYGVIPNGTLAQPTVQLGQLLMPYPEYLSLYDYAGYNGDSTYHALEVKAEKRFASGGTVLLGYTFSKSIGNSETFSTWLESAPGLGVTQDFTNLRAERSLSDFDSRQRLTLSYVLDLPVGKGKKFLPGVTGLADKLISGWGINGLTTFQDGFPLGFVASPNLTGFNTGLRPNVAAGCNKTISGSATSRLSEWFNTSCFSVPGAFTFGSESRTDPNLRSQGIDNFDIAAFKRTAITERFNLEFRAEFFNLFNRVQFGYPNTTATTAANATFGVVTSQLNSPRLIQLALRLRY